MKEHGDKGAPVGGISLPTTIAEASAALRAGSLTVRTLIEAFLKRIERTEPELNAFIEVNAEQALAEAAELDAELENGKYRGPLHGIPVVYKDLFDMVGTPTTVGSKLFAKAPPPTRDSAVARRLRTAGTISLGKTNLDEFAAGGRGKNMFFGDTRNPWDPSRSPGGSSGGSAAAVASGLCLGGIGSDTGGSIRCPASLCGVVGLRPTPGLIDLTGAHPRSYTMDAAGPLARTTSDAATLLEAMVEAPNRYASELDSGVGGMRLGIIEDFTFRDVDPEVVASVRDAVEELAGLGAQILKVSLQDSFLDLSGPLDVLMYEFDRILGDRYRAAGDGNLFGPIVRSDLERGAGISRQRYAEVLARRPERVAGVKRAFEKVDVLLTPTQPTVAPPLEADDEVFTRMRQFLLPTSFLGLPSVSVPCGFSAAGLPVGLQIIGNHYREAEILQVAAALESATRSYERRPKTN